MGLLSFIFLSGVIGSGVRHVLDVASPRSDVPASGGGCFVRRVHNEHLGVEREFYLCLVLGSGIGVFGGFMFVEVIGSGVPSFL